MKDEPSGASEQPETLSGGNVNSVVRIGSTVRRTSGPWTPTIHRLLRFARERGIDWIPEPLGIDAEGREILSFIPGGVPHEMPGWIWSDSVLTETASRLREWHDTVVGFDLSGSVWNLATHDPVETICHNDFAPYNWVFRNGRFAGAIDFDFCSPGPRVHDIAYTAYRIVPVLPPGESPYPIPEMFSRLERFLSAYAESGDAFLYPIETVLRGIIIRLEELAVWTSDHCEVTGRQTLAGHADLYRSHKRWLETLKTSGSFRSTYPEVNRSPG